MVQREGENGRNKQTPTDADDVRLSSDEAAVMTDDFVGHCCSDRACVQCHVCQTLQATINQLHSALAEQAEVDRRIRELEEGTASTKTSYLGHFSVYLSTVFTPCWRRGATVNDVGLIDEVNHHRAR